MKKIISVFMVAVCLMMAAPRCEGWFEPVKSKLFKGCLER